MKKTITLVLVLILGLVTEITYADFTFGPPTNLGPLLNTASVDATNCTSADNLELYFGSNRPGGFGNVDIWVSTRQSINEAWGSPFNIGEPVNSPYVEAYPSLSSDGITLYFSDLYSGTPRPGGLGGADIWMATRSSRNDPWSTPVNLGAPINSSAMDISPTVSADGLILVFASSRYGTSGPYDLWMSTRATVEDTWSPPVNLGTDVNGIYGELECSISADGLALFFASGRPGGLSQYDLWMTTRKSREDPWTQTVNVGTTVNSISTEGSPGVSSDMRTLYFASDRQRGFGSYDLWEAPIIPVVDLNGDRIVDAADMCIIVDNWGTDNSLCDIGPMPWGDSVVDVQDLIVLAEHLFEEILPDELIAYWTLDETEGDIAYNSTSYNYGILSGNPTWQPDSGQVAGALEFDGIDDYIRTDFVLDPSLGSFSAFVWVKGGSSGEVIISQTDSIGVPIGTGNTWLGLDGQEGTLMTGLVPPSVGWTAIKPLVSESIITDDLWHYVGFVWDGSYRILYVDGIEVAKDTAAQNPLKPATGCLHIGAGKTLHTGTFFSGLIDDVRIYDKALTAEEIAALAQ
jgi:hypothetical protein